jgi:uncharacterized protein
MKALAAFLAALSAVAALAATPVPKLATRVTDLAGALSATQRDALESKLAAFEKQRRSPCSSCPRSVTRPSRSSPAA